MADPNRSSLGQPSQGGQTATSAVDRLEKVPPLIPADPPNSCAGVAWHPDGRTVSGRVLRVIRIPIAAACASDFNARGLRGTKDTVVTVAKSVGQTFLHRPLGQNPTALLGLRGAPICGGVSRSGSSSSDLGPDILGFEQGGFSFIREMRVRPRCSFFWEIFTVWGLL